MMENQTIYNISVGAIVLMLAGLTTLVVYNNTTGEPLEPTHYCESIGIKMYCARTTAQYCRPSLETTRGSKRCIEGWKEIPAYQAVNYGTIIICPRKSEGECKSVE